MSLTSVLPGIVSKRGVANKIIDNFVSLYSNFVTLPATTSKAGQNIYDLKSHIINRDWNESRKKLEELMNCNKNKTNKDEYEMNQIEDVVPTPLETALWYDAPEDLILRLIEFDESAVKFMSLNKWYPLHFAVWKGVSSSVMELLIRKYPLALEARDEYGATPRDYINKGTLDEVTEKLVNHSSMYWLDILSKEWMEETNNDLSAMTNAVVDNELLPLFIMRNMNKTNESNKEMFQSLASDIGKFQTDFLKLNSRLGHINNFVEDKYRVLDLRVSDLERQISYYRTAAASFFSIIFSFLIILCAFPSLRQKLVSFLHGLQVKEEEDFSFKKQPPSLNLSTADPKVGTSKGAKFLSQCDDEVSQSSATMHEIRELKKSLDKLKKDVAQKYKTLEAGMVVAVNDILDDDFDSDFDLSEKKEA